MEITIVPPEEAAEWRKESAHNWKPFYELLEANKFILVDDMPYSLIGACYQKYGSQFHYKKKSLKRYRVWLGEKFEPISMPNIVAIEPKVAID